MTTAELSITGGQEVATALLEALRAENDALRAKLTSHRPRPSLKVSEKGAVSVYGLGRIPVTLYDQQWEKLLAMAEEIRDFLSHNQDKLSHKA